MAALVALTPTSSQAATPTTWSIAQPGVAAGGCDGVRANLSIDAAGSLTLGATRNCATVLEPAAVGLATTAVDLTTGLSFVSRTDGTVNVSYTTLAGKTRQRQGTATESQFVFSRGSTRMTVFVRVSGDGIAYRYELAGGGTVTREASTFQVPGSSPAYLSTFMDYYENQYSATTAAGAATADYAHPALFRVGSNWALISESDVDGRYSGARLTHTAGTGRYTVKLADAQVTFPGALVTPWRTAIIGTLDTIVGSTLDDDVAPPSRIADTSWIKPGRAAWSWLDGGRATQQSLSRQKAYVDYAARQRWEYVIVDDGWKSVTWMPELITYAKARNVGIILWYNYADVDTDAERTTQFGQIAGWGAVGVKLDFMNSDSQARLRWYDAALASAARYRLLVNLHGSTIPHGIQRTWPHVVSMEAVHGGEHRSRTLAHVTALPFTRNVVGSMDYTAVAFQHGTRPHTAAAELGLTVVYESGLQVYGGSLSAYSTRPELERFLRQVPAVWDETRLVSGDPASGVTIARRNGDRWFVGAVLPGSARTVPVPTTFLPAGRWLVEVIIDGTTLTRTTRTIERGETLSVPILANGGFAAQICPAVSGRTTCDR
ncbi:glycoside hydrolase family 97 catalytic domain-containing protein [Micromonospora sp. 067-2]|uniref:glycoside hydrolase family 97 protein n=1 Tax=Micromonospora sp. 067-2 TaxID=2789270 RepID=UPI0039781147